MREIRTQTAIQVPTSESRESTRVYSGLRWYWNIIALGISRAITTPLVRKPAHHAESRHLHLRTVLHIRSRFSLAVDLLRTIRDACFPMRIPRAISDAIGHGTPGIENVANPSSLWVVVPAYNEAKSIASVVASLRSEGYTVVVVDDGSADETADLARSGGAIVLQHCQNLGQGGALWTGITFSFQQGAQLICTFDADGQHCIEDVRRMWNCLTANDVDVVLGSRFLGSTPGISFTRKLLLQFAVLFTKLQSGMDVTDAHNGLRLMRADAASRLDLKQLGMAHASEIIDRIADLQLRWLEVPVTIRYTEYSKRKGQSTLDSMNILVDLVIGRMTR